MSDISSVPQVISPDALGAAPSAPTRAATASPAPTSSAAPATTTSNAASSSSSFAAAAANKPQSAAPPRSPDQPAPYQLHYDLETQRFILEARDPNTGQVIFQMPPQSAFDVFAAVTGARAPSPLGHRVNKTA